MQMERRVTCHGPQNVSGASQQNGIQQKSTTSSKVQVTSSNTQPKDIHYTVKVGTNRKKICKRKQNTSTGISANGIG